MELTGPMNWLLLNFSFSWRTSCSLKALHSHSGKKKKSSLINENCWWNRSSIRRVILNECKIIKSQAVRPEEAPRVDS